MLKQRKQRKKPVYRGCELESPIYRQIVRENYAKGLYNNSELVLETTKKRGRFS